MLLYGVFVDMQGQLPSPKPLFFVPHFDHFGIEYGGYVYGFCATCAMFCVLLAGDMCTYVCRPWCKNFVSLGCAVRVKIPHRVLHCVLVRNHAPFAKGATRLRSVGIEGDISHTILA